MLAGRGAAAPSLCSTGNKRLHVRDLGLYPVSLYDKKSGVGVRVSMGPAKLYAYPEIQGWFMKEKRHAQDIVELERQIEEAGYSICKVQRVQVDKVFWGMTIWAPSAFAPAAARPILWITARSALAARGEPHTTLDPES